MPTKTGSSTKPKFSLKNDLVAGVVVFLIALPLCLGIAQASGAPLFSGIIAGVIGGVVIGALSRSQLSVSGPAAGLAAIVLGTIQDLGGVEMFNLFLSAVVLSGIFQVILGFIKAGTIANFFPTAVIEGMLAGIGLTIIYNQLQHAFGYDSEAAALTFDDGERGFDWNIFSGLAGHVQWGAIVIAFVGIGILILWQTKALKKLQMIPAGLLVVIVGTLLAMFFNNSGNELLSLDNKYFVQLEIPKSTSDFFNLFTLPDFSAFLDPRIWKYGAIIAVVGSIETLLCIEATDKLDPLKRFTSGNAELKAQGIGNILSGLIGGLPITSVIVRSSANINAGGRTKRSTIFHGLLLFICVISIPTILNMIPKASLAAILIFTGYRLARPAQFKHMYKVGRTEFIPFIVTAIAVALPFIGLLYGVGLGMIISIFYLLRSNMRIPYYYQRIKSTDGDDVTTLKLAQEVSFLNKGSIKMTLESFPENSSVVIDASETEYIDFDVLELIREFNDIQAPNKNITVSLIGFKNIYKIPDVAETAEVLSQKLMNNNDVTFRSAGKYRKLIKELTDDQNNDSGQK